ncbi:MAG: hypothetical protein M3384_14025 [Acidobacteriota bacterium]|nr:hypothetical protein [Acidobacteriota bacterium]
MTTKGKNYNSIVFLTTLSVYLGLVLVGGATPQVSAQDLKKGVEVNKFNILLPGEGYVFTFDLNPIIELSRLAGKESLPVNMSGKLIPLQQKFTDWKIIAATGEQKILDFLDREFFTPAVLDPPNLPLMAKELYQSVEVDKDHITITRGTIFSDPGKGVAFAESYRRIIEYAKSPKAEKPIAGSLILTNTQVRSENNQIFIVTRLPRGSIDAHLAGKNAN